VAGASAGRPATRADLALFFSLSLARSVYDVANKKSFQNALDVWLKDLKEAADKERGFLSCIMLVGNKIDLEAE
jgi:GTPase SAR1 family protein